MPIKIFLSVLLFIASALNLKAQEEVVNLLDIRSESIKEFKGPWIFHPNELINQKPSLTDSNKSLNINSGSWNIQNPTEENWNYGTYVLRIISKKDKPIGIILNLTNSSSRVWANDELIFEKGFPSSDRTKTINKIGASLVNFIAKSDTINISIEVADFETGIGGILRPIQIGNASEISIKFSKRLVFDVIAFAIIFALSLYNILLYFYEKRSIAFLYFGLFTMFVVLRALCTGSLVIAVIFPNISSSFLGHLKLISFYMGFGLAASYFHFTFNGLFKNNLQKFVFTLAVVFSFIHFLIPLNWGYYLTLIFEVVAVFASIYCLVLIIKRIQANDKLAWYPFIGLILFLVFFGYDMLLGTGIFAGTYLIHFGTLPIAIAQSFYLGERHKRTLQQLKNIEKDNLDFAIINKTQTQEKENLIEELKIIRKTVKGSASSQFLDKLIQNASVNDFLTDQRKIILENSDKINTAFFQKLESKYPELSQSERELLALVNLKLDSKGIAIAKGISPNSVKVLKNRIRRKLNLEKGTDLLELLSHI